MTRTSSAPNSDPRPNGKALGDAVLAREPGALERAVALATSGAADDRASARAAVDAWSRRTGKSVRVAFVGSAGPVVDVLALRLADAGHAVAVLRTGASGNGAAAAPTGSPGILTVTLPSDGRGADDAIRACEIGGHDTLLIAPDAGSGDVPDDSPEMPIDCRIGSGADIDIPFDEAAGADAAALDALWSAFRRWHWDAVESGVFAERRERYRR